MEKEEILKESKKKHPVGEMEAAKINKGNWIAVIVAGVVAVAFMITEGCLGHIPAIFATACICYCWASVMYFCQFFLAKRPWPVLIGAFLEGGAGIAMFVLYIISNVQAW